MGLGVDCHFDELGSDAVGGRKMQSGQLRIGYSPLYLPAILLLVLGLAQLFFHLTLTPVPPESLLKLATDFAVFFVVVQLFSDSFTETWRRMGIAVMVFGFIFSFLSILQFLWNPSRIFWLGHDLGSPFGPYVDRDHYAGLMEMIVPISAAYVISRPKREALNGLLWFAVLVPLVSLLLTGSRGGFFSVLVELVLFGWIVVGGLPAPDGE